jgi:stress response protein YsnF
MLENDQIAQVMGREVHGPDGEKIGKAGRVYVDDESGTPTWVSVETGLLGTRSNFIPLHGASFDGDRLSVPYDRGRVKGAPDLGDGDHLSPEDEEVLKRYYSGQDSAGVRDDERRGTRDGADLDDRDDRDRTDPRGAAVGVADDDAMTVSEEQLAVSTRSVPTERVRLRKHVVTEEVTLTVTLRKERFTVEREPIAEADAGEHVGGSDFADSDQEMVLYEEVPVVQKVVRPVERIRLAKEVTTEEQTVGGEVRKERVEVDQPEDLTDRDDRGRLG